MSAKEVSPRLGRGLAALMGEPAPATSASRTAGVTTIGIEMLEPGPFQPRGPIDPKSLADLADSIRARGVLQPAVAGGASGRAA
jgi:ParB family chromosome partitioning protein